jgi:hypothetical protein
LLDAIDIEKLEIEAESGNVPKEDVLNRQKKSLIAAQVATNFAAIVEQEAASAAGAGAGAAAATAEGASNSKPGDASAEGKEAEKEEKQEKEEDNSAPSSVGSLGLAGYLVKRAVISGTDWKRRFFVARNDSIKYYRTKQDYDQQKPAKGVFHLTPGATITTGVHVAKLAPGVVAKPPPKPKRANNAKKLPPLQTSLKDLRTPKFAIAHGSNAQKGKGRGSVLLTKADRYAHALNVLHEVLVNIRMRLPQTNHWPFAFLFLQTSFQDLTTPQCGATDGRGRQKVEESY